MYRAGPGVEPEPEPEPEGGSSAGLGDDIRTTSGSERVQDAAARRNV